MIRMLLVTPSAAFEERARNGLDLTGDDLERHWQADLLDSTPVAVAHQIARHGPEVACLGPGLPVDAALAVAAALEREHPEIDIALVAKPEGSLWEQALRAGVREVIDPEANNTDISEALQRLLDAAERRRTKLTGEQSNGPKGHVITLLSPKGGSGKTVVASNLAVGLAQVAPDEVCVVDLDLQFGDMASALQLVPEHTMADVARAGSPIDITTLKVFLTPHPAHMYVLCGADSPVDAERLKPEHVGEMLQQLAREFRYVVIDTSAGLDEHTLTAIDHSTDLVLVCSMDVPSVRGLRKEVAVLDKLDLRPHRRLFVLNRADSRVGLSADDIMATVGMQVDVEISSSRAIPLSLNQGSPVVESDPRSPTAKQFTALVERFAELPGSSRGLFRRRSR